MSEEIFVNTGTSFQQPYIARQPTIGTAPTIGTVPARQPADTQTPFTYQNRSPFTYRNPVSNQTPFTYQNRTPTTYERQGQTPFTYDNRQPGTYERQGQTPFTYQNRTSTTYARQGQTPFTYQARTPSIYQHVTTQQTPFIGQARQPNIYQHVTNQQTPFIGQARQPNIYQHVTSQQTPFIGQARQPAIYQHVTTQQTPFTFQQRSPSIGQARQPSIANSRSPTITTVQQTITETNINNSVAAELSLFRTSSSNFISTEMNHYVKFVFSNGTTNGSGNTARKISLYMKYSTSGLNTAYSTPSSMTSYVLMGEYETPSGFAPDSYGVELTSETVSGGGAGITSRTYNISAGQTYGITKAYLDANTAMAWGYTDSGFAYTTRLASECYSVNKIFTENFALTFMKSGYPNIVVDTFKVETEHTNTHTGSGGCF